MTEAACTDNGVPQTEPPDSAKKDLLDAYRLVLDVWKVNNDNYFKRVQFLMAAVQGVLIIAILQFASKPFPSWESVVVPAMLCLLGMLSAVEWNRLNDRQNQYMEFCRRTLRNLEKKLGNLGVALHYFTAESLVFFQHQQPKKDPEIPGIRTQSSMCDGKIFHAINFTWSGEKYPEAEDQKKNIHQLGRVRGGMNLFERRVARWALAFWIVVFAAFILIVVGKVVQVGTESRQQPNQQVECMLAAMPVLANENIVHDDGTGAQISFYLPTHGKQDGQEVEYTTFRITVVKDNKFLLFADLAGTKTEDGKTFFGKIVIPSDLIDSAEILMLGSPRNSSLGIEKKLKVNTFKKVTREKSWTDQK